MKTKQTIKLNMFLGIRNFKRRNEAEAATIPKFPENSELLLKATDELQELSEEQGKERTGITLDKNLLRRHLVDLCLKYSNKVAILSLQNENYTLLKEIQFRESQFRNMKGTKLREKAQLIYDNVQANLEELADQGISAETQKEFSEAITAFNDFLSMPRTVIAERKKTTMRINEIFAAADKYLKIMDLAVESAKKEHPDFYNNYRTARMLVDTGSRSLAVKASVKGLPYGVPLGGVVFIFRNTGTGGELVKKSTNKGNFHIKSIKPGPWKVFVSKEGYKNYETEINVSENQTSVLNVELEKA